MDRKYAYDRLERMLSLSRRAKKTKDDYLRYFKGFLDWIEKETSILVLLNIDIGPPIYVWIKINRNYIGKSIFNRIY